MTKHSIPNQRGAVLVVSLILLLLITVIAVATMTSSTFQTAMVVNAQQSDYTFRSAESAADDGLVVALLPFADARYEQNGKKPSAFDVPSTNLHPPRNDISVSAKLYRMGNGAPPLNQGLGLVQTRIYEVVGAAESADKKTSTKVAQGAAVLQPIPEGGGWD
ncbi:MAG: PilX N-terminal domain-containing pilus assembly protein [Spongiibacteraceae bacterium]